jgi:dienelactone hydrolase
MSINTEVPDYELADRIVVASPEQLRALADPLRATNPRFAARACCDGGAEVLLFHHAQGQTDGFAAFTDELRQAGHTVHAPDLYDGRTFASNADPIFVGEGDLDAARAIVESAEQAELFLYPGDQHYFADSSLPSYDENAARLLTQRILAFLEQRG